MKKELLIKYMLKGECEPTIAGRIAGVTRQAIHFALIKCGIGLKKVMFDKKTGEEIKWHR